MALRRGLTLLVVAGALALPLAACGGTDGQRPQPGGPDASGQAPASIGDEADAPVPAGGAGEASEASASEDGESAEASAADGGADDPAAAPVEVEVKTALEASDPAAFRLASGSPQLVEFFAFW